MNPEPTFRGGPGQRAALEQAKLRAAASAAAPSLFSPATRKRQPKRSSPSDAANRPSEEAGGTRARREANGEAKGRPLARKPAQPRAAKAGDFAGEEVWAPAHPRASRAGRKSVGFWRSWRVPITVLKNIFGFFLLPLAWISTETFVGALTRTTVHQQYWRTEDFRFFILGIGAWLVVFMGSLYIRGEPPALWFYVLGHEWTHAIWAWLSHGEVSEIKVHREGGHILTNKPTVLVTLAPYFYPVLCVILVFVFCIVQIFYPLHEAPPLINSPFLSLSPLGLFVFLLGAAWGFHMSFTVWMIRRGQSDLRMHGNLFSIVLIYLGNLMVLTLFLILTAPGVGVRSCARELLRNTVDFSDAVWNLFLFLRTLA